MVKHSLPQIHPKASTGVFARHLLKNDRSSVFQTLPKPNRTNPKENIVGDSFSLLMG
jgi:hypothetical protein